jgi:bifunctional non-homologous end joining protein LigD
MAGKLDGTRCICFKLKNKVKFLNRRGLFFEKRYPEIVKCLKELKDDIILDGEIVVFDERGKPNFYLLAEREHTDDKIRIDILSRKYPATYVVFDILNLNGEDLKNLPLLERKKILNKVVKDSERVKKCYYTEDGKALWKVVKKLKLEGVMVKRKDSPYLQRRSDLWLKVKTLKSLDVIICGYTEGTGKRRGVLGAILCGIYYKNRLIYLGRCGTGFDEKQLNDLTTALKRIEVKRNPFQAFKEERSIIDKIHFTKLKFVAEVKFMNLSENLKMRAPSFKRLRSDKKIEECVLRERELKKLL